MLIFLYEYGCLCLSQVGGHFQAAELAFIMGGSGECKRSEDGARPPAFTHVLVCPFIAHTCVFTLICSRTGLGWRRPLSCVYSGWDQIRSLTLGPAQTR